MILWGMALGEYYSGDKNQAYEYLGHIAHLLTDMSVPAHAHDDSHVFLGGDTFDDKYMKQGSACGSDDPAHECLTPDEKERIRAAGPLVPEGDKLFWLFYTTAQLAGMYASDQVNGNIDLEPGNPISVDFSEFDPGDGCDDETVVEGDWDTPGSSSNLCMQVIRNNSYLRSIRAVAALYKLFAEQTKKQEELTLLIESIQELECHDDIGEAGCESGPEYFVRVKIGDFWFRNEGNHADDTPVISKTWGFARNVGTTGTVDVWIELLDDDDGDDDPSDIYDDPDGEERALWLTVDLEKCRSGAPDAIQGDLTGPCGVQLTSAGDDDDRSQIWFRILPPNSPPTAEAGLDQTVNEGDSVTLTGTFTDPDIDDTHTFLWHLVSSTNGHAVPDATTQSLSFTPIDDGVYTFSFTVTDNHGAEGIDTVEVTAQNVPPVVSAPYISNQPNAEFILPVVHDITFKGTFTDAGKADTHTAVWDWGDGTTSNGTVTETNGSGNVTKSHTYSLPGNYTVTLTVTDDDGGIGSNTMTIHVAGVGETLNIFDAYIQSLPANVFKNNASQRKAAFANMFVSLRNKLAVRNYNGMILSMENEIRTKFDGLVGGKANDDWIVENLSIQKELCQKVDDITSYLQYLQSTRH